MSYYVLQDAHTAALELSELRDRVDQEQAQMAPEAYWLLYYNVRQAYRNVVPPLGLACSLPLVERGAVVSCAPPPGSSVALTGGGSWEGRRAE